MAFSTPRNFEQNVFGMLKITNMVNLEVTSDGLKVMAICTN
jgi:hypothetical protein